MFLCKCCPLEEIVSKHSQGLVFVLVQIGSSGLTKYNMHCGLKIVSYRNFMCEGQLVSCVCVATN